MARRIPLPERHPGVGSWQELEVALEATTGWRFVVEELRRVGASVHLACARVGNEFDAPCRSALKPTGSSD
jgi:hypothetical protein